MPRRVLGDASMKKHLQQHITELIAQRIGVATADGVEQLVSLLQQETAQRVVGLLALPRPGGSQFVHHRDGVHQPLSRLTTGRGNQALAGGQPGRDRRVVGIRGQQHRGVLPGVRRACRRQRPRHRNGHLLGVLHFTGEQLDGFHRDQRRPTRIDQDRLSSAPLLTTGERHCARRSVPGPDSPGLPTSAATNSATICTNSKSRMRGAPTPPARGIGTCTADAVAR